jgi:hypothetical protein
MPLDRKERKERSSQKFIESKRVSHDFENIKTVVLLCVEGYQAHGELGTSEGEG